MVGIINYKITAFPQTLTFISQRAKMTAQKLQFDIQNLTGKSKNGEVYYRRPEVLRELQEIQGSSLTELKQRISVADEKDDNALKSETLIYLLRELFQKNGFNEIYETLSKRILRIVYKENPEGEDFEDFAQRIQLKFLEFVLDFETDSGDFAQVSFGQFVIGLALNEKSRFYTVNKRQQVTDSVEDESEDDERSPKFHFESRTLSPEQEVFVDQSLRQLPQNLREAFILHHYYNYQVKSKKKDKPTLTEYFQKSDKTIRNWLKEAEEILEDLRNQGV